MGAHRFAQLVKEYLDHPENWDWDELEWIVTCAFPDAKTLEPTLDRLFDYRRVGAEANGTKDDEFKLDGKTLNSYGMQREVKKRCLLGINALMQAPLQGHGMWMRFVRGEAKDISARFYEGGESIFTRGHRDGRTEIIYGNRGTGKTTFAFEYLLPDCLRAGLYCVGNVHLEDDLGVGPTKYGHVKGAPLYTFSETLSGTLLAICDNRLEERATARFFDETQMGQMRTRVASDKYQTQKLIWHIERKLWCITVAILQLETDVPTELKGFADIYIKRPSLTDKSLVDVTHGGHTEYYKGVRAPSRRHKEIKEMGLPVPRIDTDAWGVFVVDLNYADLLAYVAEEVRINLSSGSKERVSVQQVKALREYIIKHSGEASLDDRDRAKVYWEIYQRLRCTLVDLSELTGWSSGKLSQWFNKLYPSEKGKHPRGTPLVR